MDTAVITLTPAPVRPASLLKRIPALDGLRGMASLMVLAYHLGPHIVRTAGSHFNFLLRFPRHGAEGVDLFFVLSGFLISGILVNARDSRSYFKTFYARRAFRIFPLYFLVLAGYTASVIFLGPRAGNLGRLFAHPLPLWTYWLYLQNFGMAAAGSYGAVWMAGSWSLAIEEQFYLILPAVVRIISDRTLLLLATAGMLMPAFLRAIVLHTPWVPGMSASVLLPTRIDSLSAGILVMLLLRNHRDTVRAHGTLIRALGIATAAFWFVFPVLPPNISLKLQFLNYTTSAVAFGLFLLNLLLTPEGWLSRLLSSRGLRLTGNMSYSTYLLHPILLCFAFRLMRGADPRLNGLSDLPPLAIALLATITLSWASWRWLERPLLDRGHRFRY